LGERMVDEPKRLVLDIGTEVKLISVREDEVLAVIMPPGRRWDGDAIRSMEASWRRAGCPCKLVVFTHGTVLARVKAANIDLDEGAETV
jgi:hypothetical protein